MGTDSLSAEDPVDELAQLAAEATDFEREFNKNDLHEILNRIRITLWAIASVKARDTKSVKLFLQQEITSHEETLPMGRVGMSVVLKVEERRSGKKRTLQQRNQVITGKVDILKLLLQIFEAYYTE